MSLHKSGSASLVQIHPGALLVSADPLFEIRGDQIMALAARHVVPAIYGLRDYVVTGGLISYAPSWPICTTGSAFTPENPQRREAGRSPVQQPTKFVLVLNLKTAKAPGQTIPQSILARADEIIE
jgi:hypothetical protein